MCQVLYQHVYIDATFNPDRTWQGRKAHLQLKKLSQKKLNVMKVEYKYGAEFKVWVVSLIPCCLHYVTLYINPSPMDRVCSDGSSHLIFTVLGFRYVIPNW